MEKEMGIGLDQKAVEGEVSLAMIDHGFKSLVNTVVGAADTLTLGLFNALLVVRAHGRNIDDDPVSSDATFPIDLPCLGVDVTNEQEVESNVMPFIEAQAFT